MPVLQPAELWKRSGRYDIDEVFKLQDRRGAELVLALSHEENLTFHMAREVRSYRDLPKLLYHFQTKERDEARPRAGVLRTREFIMKDAYSFDRDREGLDRSYEPLRGRLRPHLRPRRARVVPGRVRRGGDGRLRRARVHGALPGRRERRGPLLGRATPPTWRWRAPRRSPWTACPRRWTRPSASRRPRPPPSIRWPASWACPPGAIIKAFPVFVEDRGPVLVVIRGDHRLNEIKLQNALGAAVRAAEPEEVKERVRRRAGLHRPRGRAGGGGGRPGARGPRAGWWPAGTSRTCTCAASSRGATSRRPGPTCAASRRATPPRTAPRSRSSPRSRSGTSSSSACATPSRSAPRYLDEEGREQLVWMGSYGIGPARVVAAAVEQGADEQGIAWPRAVAPVRRGARDARQGGGGGANRGRPPLRGAARGRARRALRRPHRQRRARSSPTPSCSAARCG